MTAIRTPLVSAFLAVALYAVSVSPGHGQDSAQAFVPVLRSPQDISRCLCLERDLATRTGGLNERRRDYEARVRHIADAEAALERRRSAIDVDKPAEVEAFKRQLDALDTMRASFRQDILPGYQAAVMTYNDLVADYTKRCAGHAYDLGVRGQVEPTLVCPIDR